MTYEELGATFVRELDAILGERIVSVFTYGAAMFPPAPVTDFDAHVLVDEPLDADTAARIDALHKRLHSTFDDMDVWYITVDDAKHSTAPKELRNASLFDESWPLHRAHIHAGRYRRLAGVDPATIVAVPTWDELDTALQHEREWLAARLDESPDYSVLNLCRIAASYANNDVVMSKLQGALWALAALPDEHHQIIRDALDAYRTKTFGRTDARTFYEVMRPLVEKP